MKLSLKHRIWILLFTLFASGILVIPVQAKDKAFQYVHDPRMNCNAMKDIVVNPDAIYGFSPRLDGSLFSYASYDWTSISFVSSAKQTRSDYHADFEKLYQLWEDMKSQGYDDKEIAIAVSDGRNQIRIDSYKDDPEGLAAMKARNLQKYGNENGPSAEWIKEQYHLETWLEVIYKAFSSNSGMDACVGLYDEQYNHNLLTGSIKDHTLDQGKVTKKASRTEEGEIVYTCSVCNTQLTESIPKLKEDISVSKTDKAKTAINSNFKVKQKKNSLTIHWGKVDGAAKYKVYAGYCGGKTYDYTKTFSSKKQSVILKKIKGKSINSNKNFKVYVIAQNKSGKTLARSLTAHVSGDKNKKYTNARKIVLRKKSISLKVNQTKSVGSKTEWIKSGKRRLSHCKEFRYISSNSKVARVTSSGKIKGIAAGSCLILVCGENGCFNKLSVNVK